MSESEPETTDAQTTVALPEETNDEPAPAAADVPSSPESSEADDDDGDWGDADIAELRSDIAELRSDIADIRAILADIERRRTAKHWLERKLF